MATKYDSSVNVLGSIPDYSSMIDFICEYCGRASEGQGSFSFRTHKTFSRFLAAIDVLALLHHIKETEPGEFTWSEATLKICASKYLTILKKLNLADGGSPHQGPAARAAPVCRQDRPAPCQRLRSEARRRCGQEHRPTQKAGLLSYDVLNSGQLKKYLNADW